jgi:hypothetical protein
VLLDRNLPRRLQALRSCPHHPSKTPYRHSKRPFHHPSVPVGRCVVYTMDAMIDETLPAVLFRGQAAALAALLFAGPLAGAEYTITAGGGSPCAPGSNIVVFTNQKEPARALPSQHFPRCRWMPFAPTRMHQMNIPTDQLLAHSRSKKKLNPFRATLLRSFPVRHQSNYPPIHPSAAHTPPPLTPGK